MKKYLGAMLAGFCCGVINGLFGGGGGMILVPLLTLLTPIQEDQVFPASISIVLPILSVATLTVVYSVLLRLSPKRVP